jgi:hypothetical protein
MKFPRIQFIVNVLILLILSGCTHQPRRSFYYWKSVYQLSAHEKETLKELQVSKLYIRFFDVDVDGATGKTLPVATITFADSILPGIEVVPVVYVVNKTLKNTALTDIPALASNIMNRVNSVAARNHIYFNELQMDCDWTDGTREKYFDLLRNIKSGLSNEKVLSATIRLHQVKYKEMTGLPPVDRGMLMYYNMGKISAEASHNSVFNAADAAKYIDHLSDYPLPLDVALPAYSWGIHIRNNEVIDLISTINSTAFANHPGFKRLDVSTFVAIQSFFYHGFYFMENDRVKMEEVTPEQCIIAAQQLKSKLKKATGSVAIFHVDSLIFTQYEKEDFEKVFDVYR